MWFNPMIYFYQQRITLVHEYISDAVVSKKEAKEIYINNLLSHYFQVENISFVNQFYKQSLIKKRIMMMKRTQSKKMNQLKYLVLIPALVSFHLLLVQKTFLQRSVKVKKNYQLDILKLRKVKRRLVRVKKKPI